MPLIVGSRAVCEKCRLAAPQGGDKEGRALAPEGEASKSIRFLKNEYQFYSGWTRNTDRGGVCGGEGVAGAKARPYFRAVCGTTEVVPCYRASAHAPCLSKIDIHLLKMPWQTAEKGFRRGQKCQGTTSVVP